MAPVNSVICTVAAINSPTFAILGTATRYVSSQWVDCELMRAAKLKDGRLYRVQLNDGETETCVHAACSTLGA